MSNFIVTERGRDQTYAQRYIARTDPPRGCVDATLVLDRFSDILDVAVQAELLARNVVFCRESVFRGLPPPALHLCGNRRWDARAVLGFRARCCGPKKRDEADNQYMLLERAGVRYPQQFARPAEIDRLVIVKAPHAKISFERAFFLARSAADYERQSATLLASGMVDEAGLAGAVIEEFALGPSLNLNFFYSPLLDELELMGTDTRRQTNLEGLKNLPFTQAQALADEPVRLEEAGHIAATLTESMLEKAFDMGERFVRATQAGGKRGIIGPVCACSASLWPDRPKTLWCTMFLCASRVRPARASPRTPPIAGAAMCRLANELPWSS